MTLTESWADGLFGGLSINEVIFHLKVPLKGTDSGTIIDFIRSCLIPSLFGLVMMIVLYRLPSIERRCRNILLHRTGREPHLLISVGKRQVIQTRAFATFHIPIWILTVIAVFVFMWRGYGILQKYSVIDYMNAQKQSSVWIEEHYVEPDLSLLTFPEEKRNLIYIFLESMESSYMSVEDGGAFDVDLIPELTALAKNSVSFSNATDRLGGAVKVEGTGWTIAGMFAQSAGLPLNLPIDSNAMGEYSKFFPGVTSLGDLLAQAGYHNCLMIGSEAVFGGRNQYFSQHGDYEILDYDWAVENRKIPEGYHVFWGIEDMRLVELVKKKLLELAANEEPFNLTMLTVDTHFPDGYLCPLCRDDFDSSYKNALSCSSRQIGALVEWIQEQDFYENTTIVIAGDHLTMATGVIAEIPEGYTRGVYNCFVNSAVDDGEMFDRTFTTMDLFPTTLAAMGVTIEGERLALGTNLFSGEPTLAEEVGIQVLDREMGVRSEFYMSKLLYGE